MKRGALSVGDDGAGESLERVLDHLASDVTGDEDDLRALVGFVRPGRQFDRRVEQVLHAMHGDRGGLALDVQDAFDPQQVLALCRDQHFHPGDERVPGDGFIDNQAE